MVGVVGSSPIVPTRISAAIVEMARHEKAHFPVCFFFRSRSLPSAPIKHQARRCDIPEGTGEEHSTKKSASGKDALFHANRVAAGTDPP